MKTMLKYAIVAAGFIAFAGAATSQAETPSFVNVSATSAVSTGSAHATVGMVAEFVSAATFSIQPKDPAANSKTQAPLVSVGEVHEAHLVIGGLPGEAVQVSCAVSNGHGVKSGIRDCGGSTAVEQHSVISGQQMDDGILLTQDMLPDDSGAPRSAIVLDVSYL